MKSTEPYSGVSIFVTFNDNLAVLSKIEIPGSPNGPSTMDRWVVRVTFGWSVYDAIRNENETTIS